MTRPFLPGVPAAGHITVAGWWHPGRPDGCPKCDRPRPRPRRPAVSPDPERPTR